MIDDLTKFHPIRKDWTLVEEVLEEEHTIVDVEDVEVGGVKGEDSEVVHGVEREDTKDIEGGESDIEVVGEVDKEGIPARPNTIAPSSPILGVPTDDESLPPTSDASTEFIDAIDSDDGEVWGGATLKRKASYESGPGTKRWKAARTEEGGLLSGDGSGAETDGGKGSSRSARGRRRLCESARSGEFTIDEGKQKRFEEKCTGMDRGAKFRYQDSSWRVLHSKCLKWFKMSEPYNATKFRSHIGTCKAKGSGHNASITTFFKPRDPNDVNAAEAKPKITVSGRKQIFVGSGASTLTAIESLHSDNQLVSKTHPCLGISDLQDPRVSQYISRTVVEGAGSISLQKATQQLYGDLKYSELSDKQKATVAVTQAHLRSWSINRELQVVFSTNCTKFVERDRRPTTMICDNCRKVVDSEAFKRALRVKIPPLEAMKFIPNKYRNAMADLGAKFAKIHGLPELLQEVSSAASGQPLPRI